MTNQKSKVILRLYALEDQSFSLGKGQHENKVEKSVI